MSEQVRETETEDSDKMGQSPEETVTYCPELMIPFRYSQEDAIRAFHDYYDGRPLLPSVIKKDPAPEEMQGGFVPYLLYSGTADVDITYEAQDSQKVGGDPKVVKQLRDYTVHRAGTAKYHRVQVNASKEVTDAFMETLEPFQYKDLKPIEETAEADRLQELTEIAEDRKNAERKLSSTICESFRGTVRHDYVKETEQHITFHDEKVECVLCPMWVRQVKIGRRYYNFAMNGQTGKIHADIPPSRIKSILTFLGCFIVGTGIPYLLMWLTWHYLGRGTETSGQVIALLSVIFGFIATNVFMQKLFRRMKQPKKPLPKPNLAQKHYGSCTVHLTVEKEKLVRRQMVNNRNVAVKTEEY